MTRQVMAVVLALALAAGASAAVVPVPLTLDPATSSVNSAAITVTGSYSGISDDDTKTATVTGTMATKLTIDFHPTTRQVTSLTGLEFTGGRVYFSDLSMQLDFYAWIIYLGSVKATGTGLQGTFDTPDSLPPPGAVTGGQFNAADHEVILDHGTFYAVGSGGLETLLPPTTINLADEPIHATTEATGTLTAALQGVNIYTATYQAVLTMPLDFDEEVYNQDGVVVSVAASGTIRSRGNFSVVAPPLPGDANLDGRVNDLDASILAAHWQMTGTAQWGDGDFNGDRRVSDLDASILAANWQASIFTAVPEPSTLAGLVALALAGLAIRRR